MFLFAKTQHGGRFMQYFSSDLACERRRADLDVEGVSMQRERHGDFLWERISITSGAGAESIGRPVGRYDTLTLPRMESLDDEEIYDAAEEIAKELCILCDSNGIYPDRILVVGLGNGNLTPDSIGPKAAQLINATMHVKSCDEKLFDRLDCSEIAVLTPGVSSFSGMDAAEVVTALCQKIHPDVIFAIDSLAARDADRLGRTIQISDTGIFPGSGIGNTRAALDEQSLGVTVISLGVPTVINAKAFLAEGAGTNSDKSDGLFVSPKDIDSIAQNSARIIATGINQAFGIL